MITIDYDTEAHCFEITFVGDTDLRGGSTRNLTERVNADYLPDGTLAGMELIGDSPAAVADLLAAAPVIGVDPDVLEAAVNAALAAPNREITLDVGPVLARPA